MLGWAPWDESNATCQTQRFLWMIARHHPTTFMEQAEASSHFLLFFFLSDIQSMRDEAHTGIAEASTCFRTSLLQNIILFTSLSTFFPLVLDFPHLWVPVYQWPYWILVVCHTDPVWRAAQNLKSKKCSWDSHIILLLPVPSEITYISLSFHSFLSFPT